MFSFARRLTIGWMLLAVATMTGCSAGQPASRVELIVSAAASLTDSLEEIQAGFEQNNPRIKLTFNYGASGTLQQQIEQGAPSDVFISAGKKQMDALVAKRLVDGEWQSTLLTNELVVVIPADAEARGVSVKSPEQLADPEVKKLAVGQPDTVPAGAYAKEALTHYRLWDTLQPKIVYAKDVRQVMGYVETGNTEAGIVYRTDALSSTKVKVAFTVDPQSYQPIEYPMGLVKGTKHPEEAKKLYAYLQSEAAAAVFAKYGFRLPGQGR